MSGVALLMVRSSTPDSEVPEWIREVRREMGLRGWSGNELAARTGLSNAWTTVTINQGKRGQQPRRDTLVRIAQAFNQPASRWLRLGGLAPADGADTVPLVSFDDLVDARPELTDAQKDTLKMLYASMVPLGSSGKIGHQRRRRTTGS